MKTYRLHNCTARHRSGATMARCIWPRAHWITGYHYGTYASVSYCRGTTVMLWDTAELAEAAVRDISGACGGACRNNHHVIHLDIPAHRPAAQPTERAA